MFDNGQAFKDELSFKNSLCLTIDFPRIIRKLLPVVTVISECTLVCACISNPEDNYTKEFRTDSNKCNISRPWSVVSGSEPLPAVVVGGSEPLPAVPESVSEVSILLVLLYFEVKPPPKLLVQLCCQNYWESVLVRIFNQPFSNE